MYICINVYIMIVYNVTKINMLYIYICIYMCTFSDKCFTYVIVLFMYVCIYICKSKNIYVYIYIRDIEIRPASPNYDPTLGKLV